MSGLDWWRCDQGHDQDHCSPACPAWGGIRLGPEKIAALLARARGEDSPETV